MHSVDIREYRHAHGGPYQRKREKWHGLLSLLEQNYIPLCCNRWSFTTKPLLSQRQNVLWILPWLRGGFVETDRAVRQRETENLREAWQFSLFLWSLLPLRHSVLCTRLINCTGQRRSGFLGVQSAPFPIRKETARSSGRKVSIDIQPGLLTHSLSVSACETVRRRSYELEINSSCSFFTARFARKRDFRHRWRRRFHLHNWHAPVSSAATPHSGPPPQVSSDFRNLELWRFTFQIPPVGEVVKQQSLSLIRPYVLKCICIY